MPGLYPYQQDYIRNLPKSAILAADTGLGKGQMSLAHYKKHNPNGRLLVVAPASKVREGGWRREFDIAELPQAPVISYERFTKDCDRYLSPELTVIFDEMHFVCNSTTKRGKAAIKVGRTCKQWIGLSATALPNGWRSAETYAILTGLVRNKTQFVNRFVVIDRSRGFPLILGYREKDTLTTWWNGIAKPLARSGDQHLPSQSIAVAPAMPPKLATAYRKAVKERTFGDELLDSPSKLFSTLRQIPTPARVDALQSIVESTDEHIVIFYNFNAERDAVLEMLSKNFKERTVYEQSGHKSHLPARSEWGNIKPSITLVQYQSGSQAIELTYASVTVYLSPCTSYANYEQSKGRTRRNGQEKTTLFYHIAAENSLDKHIWGILSQKRDFSMTMFEKTIAES